MLSLGLLALLSLLALGSAAAQSPAIPDPTLPASPAHLRLTALGVGVQVYACTHQGNGFAWVFQEPRADLFDPRTHRPVGTHTQGPTWTWSDGSSVVGTVLHQQPAPGPAQNIAWLLLAAHPSSAPGALHDIAFVRRSDTQAGEPSNSACDAEHAGNLAQVPYSAMYSFYSAN